MGENAHDYVAIKNTIASYCFALDEKKFDLLHEVFTEDAETIYPFRGPITGAQAVADAIEQRLRPVITQHALTTQHVSIDTPGKTAKAITYFTGIHFGRGKWDGQQVTAWGKYVDLLKCVDSRDPSVPGASGTWRIYQREVNFVARRGEEGVMDGE